MNIIKINLREFPQLILKNFKNMLKINFHLL